MFYQRIQKATHLHCKISQKYMPTSPGLEDAIILCHNEAFALDVDNEITIYSNNPKPMHNINCHIRPISPPQKMHTCKYFCIIAYRQNIYHIDSNKRPAVYLLKFAIIPGVDSNQYGMYIPYMRRY